MALTASTAYATMIAGVSYVQAQSFTITLPSVGIVDLSAVIVSIDLDCQNNTDLPDNLRDVEGDSVAGGTVVIKGYVTVNGSMWQIADLFNPDCATFPPNPSIANPLYRREIRGSQINLKIGGKPAGTTEVLSKLDPGLMTAYSIDHGDGTVSLSVADLTAGWKSLQAIPSVVTAPPYNAGLTSEFVMDAIVRTQSGKSTWPAKRANSIVSVGFRASLAPEIGTLSTFLAAQPVFKAGKFGSALTATNGNNNQPGYIQAQGIVVDQASPMFIEFWASGAVTVNWLGGLNIQYDPTTNNRILIALPQSNGSVTLTIPNSTDFHYVGVAFSCTPGTTNYTLTVYYDGATLTTGSRTATNTWNTGSGTGGLFMLVGTGSTIEALQITTESGTPASNGSFTPAAVIDPSLNPLVIPLSIDPGTAARDELTTIAAAELGYARVDEQGIFRFSNRVTLANRQVTDGTSPRIVSASTSLKNLTTSVPASSQFNRIQIPYTPWTFGKASLVWTLDSARVIKVGQTVSWVQNVGDDVLAANMAGPINVLPNNHTISDGANWARYSSDPNGANANTSPNITGNVVQLSANTVRVTITNKSANPAYLVSPASYTDITVGTLALWIGGVPVTATDGQMAEAVYGAGDSLYAADTNPYRQDETAARAVAAWLLNQLVFAIRDFEDVDIVPDARIQIGDLIRLQSTKAHLDEYVRVWGWNYSISADSSSGSWSQTLNVRALGPPGAWLGAISGRSEGGVTTYGYG